MPRGSGLWKFKRPRKTCRARSAASKKPGREGRGFCLRGGVLVLLNLRLNPVSSLGIAIGFTPWRDRGFSVSHGNRHAGDGCDGLPPAQDIGLQYHLRLCSLTSFKAKK